MRISVAKVRSCASSRIMVEYRSSFGSFIASRRSIPSVMYFKNVVPFSVISSNRIEYPTCFPSWTTDEQLCDVLTHRPSRRRHASPRSLRRLDGVGYKRPSSPAASGDRSNRRIEVFGSSSPSPSAPPSR